jgi:hypothetical protein
MDWIRTHDNFGLQASKYEARWINLARVGNTNWSNEFPCDHCDYIASRRSIQRIHVDGEHRKAQAGTLKAAAVRSYQRTECPPIAKPRAGLLVHMGIHVAPSTWRTSPIVEQVRDPIRHNCDDCSISFARRGNLENHQLAEHRGDLR